MHRETRRWSRHATLRCACAAQAPQGVGQGARLPVSPITYQRLELSKRPSWQELELEIADSLTAACAATLGAAEAHSAWTAPPWQSTESGTLAQLVASCDTQPLNPSQTGCRVQVWPAMRAPPHSPRTSAPYTAHTRASRAFYRRPLGARKRDITRCNHSMPRLCVNSAAASSRAHSVARSLYP